MREVHGRQSDLESWLVVEVETGGRHRGFRVYD
jgi:hypothetical protein